MWVRSAEDAGDVAAEDDDGEPLDGGTTSSLSKGQRCNDVPCQFCGKKDGDGHLFWECTFQPLLHVRELPAGSYYMTSLPTLAWLVAWS